MRRIQIHDQLANIFSSFSKKRVSDQGGLRPEYASGIRSLLTQLVYTVVTLATYYNTTHIQHNNSSS